MKKPQKRHPKSNKNSTSKKKLLEIGHKLGVAVPEDLKNFDAKKKQDNEVVGHLTGSNTNTAKKMGKNNRGHSNHHMDTPHTNKSSSGCPHINKAHSNLHTNVIIPPLQAENIWNNPENANTYIDVT